jgi:hypothetical protein
MVSSGVQEDNGPDRQGAAPKRRRLLAPAGAPGRRPQVDQGINLGPQEPYKEGDQAEEPNDETPAHGLPLTPALT